VECVQNCCYCLWYGLWSLWVFLWPSEYVAWLAVYTGSVSPLTHLLIQTALWYCRSCFTISQKPANPSNSYVMLATALLPYSASSTNLICMRKHKEATWFKYFKSVFVEIHECLYIEDFPKPSEIALLTHLYSLAVWFCICRCWE